MPIQPPRQPQRPQGNNANRQAQQGRHPAQNIEHRVSAEQYADAMRRRAFAKRKAQEKKRRMYIRRRILFGIMCVLLLGGIAFAVYTIFSRDKSKKLPSSSSQISSNANSETEDEPGSLPSISSGSALSETNYGQSDASALSITTLVNANNPIPKGYIPNLESINSSGHEFDKRGSDELKKMLKEGNETGLQLMVCSSYRSTDRQTKLFDQMKADYISKGMSEKEAYDKTKSIRAIPGTSEHETGLAADIVSEAYQVLDNGFEKTPEFNWLRENCAQYGFILRYPREKTSITGVIYEPWHYRYVGVEMAKKVMEQGVCLEEYVELNK